MRLTATMVFSASILRGPGGNTIVVIAGTRDEGVRQTAKSITNPTELREALQQTDLTFPAEALVEVTALDGVNLTGKLLVAVRLLGFVHHRLRFLTFPMRTGSALPVKPKISRFPCKERARMPGSSTTPGRPSARIAHPFVLPSMFLTMSAPRTTHFRGSMAGLHVPLSTLR